jgi:hypothetical protein
MGTPRLIKVNIQWSSNKKEKIIFKKNRNGRFLIAIK